MGDVACPLPRYIVPSLSATPFPGRWWVVGDVGELSQKVDESRSLAAISYFVVRLSKLRRPPYGIKARGSCWSADGWMDRSMSR